MDPLTGRSYRPTSTTTAPISSHDLQDDHGAELSDQDHQDRPPVVELADQDHRNVSDVQIADGDELLQGNVTSNLTKQDTNTSSSYFSSANSITLSLQSTTTAGDSSHCLSCNFTDKKSHSINSTLTNGPG